MDRHVRTLVGITAAVLTTVTTLGVAAPAGAHGAGPGGGSGVRGGGGSSAGHRADLAFTLTAGATATLDAYEAEVEAVGAARVVRNDDDLIVVSLGQRRSHGRGASEARVAGVSFTVGSASSTWTELDLDRQAEVVTAELDGTDDVAVLDLVTTTSTSGERPRRTVELVLTEAAADALDAVIGSDEFDAGDVFATAGRGCRPTASVG